MALSRVNGVDLYWERTGSGPPLLFCNGSGSTLADIRPLLEPLAAAFDLLAYDQRGLGRSAAAPGPYGMSDLAADAIGITEHAGWDTFGLLGVSFGGMVAQELSVTWPQRVRRLALVCTSSGGEGGSSYRLHELLELPLPAQRAARRTLLDTRFDDGWLAAHPADRALAEHLTAERDAAGEPGRRAQLEARRGHDVWDRLGLISCPTLVACGRYDGIAPPRNSAAIASRIPDAQLRVYEGGHAFLFQDPAALPEVVTFLDLLPC